MKIIEVPHPHLRQKSQVVTEVTPQLTAFIKELSSTLAEKRNPRGVGLSAPQVDTQLAVFVTYLVVREEKNENPVMRTFINPQVIETSKEKILGEEGVAPILEGCLSIPHLYGPVPRYKWVEVAFDTIEKGQLIPHQERFQDFAARVMQHEFDHLHGKLFTDYVLEFELPLYDDSSGKLEKIDRKIAAEF